MAGVLIMLRQGTPEWLRWRADGIGGSDAPSIMGVSPYASAAKLLREKLGQDEREQTFAMKRGSRLEEQARRALEERTGVLLEPACMQSFERPWMRASLDGIDVWGDVICEIKCPGMQDHRTAFDGDVPEKYYPQCQHNLAVSGASICLYASWSPEKGAAVGKPLVIVEVRPDREYIERLVAEEEAFMRLWREKRSQAA